jgi:hypothetical protein
MAREKGHHQHEALKHRHKHYHVTHYLHQGENWGHVFSTHAHASSAFTVVESSTPSI